MAFVSDNRRSRRLVQRVGAVAGVSAVLLAAAACSNASPAPPEVPQAAAVPSPIDAEVVTGDVRVAGEPRSGVVVVLRVYSGPKPDLTWTVSRITDARGHVRFGSTDFPVAEWSNGSYRGAMSAEASGYESDTAELRLDRVRSAGKDSALVVTATPRAAIITLTILERKLFYFLLLPALAGLLFAIWSITVSRLHTDRWWRRTAPAIYAMSVSALWILAVALIVRAYVTTGQDVVPMGPGRLTIPSALIIASFLGSLTFVAYSVHAHSPLFGSEVEGPRREFLLMIGGRVLVAPYVAAIGYGIITPALPPLSSPAFALFFGFFAGLWINPVLEAFAAIGRRLLSEDTLARLKASTLTPDTRGSSDVRRPALSSPSDSVAVTTDKGDLSLLVDRSRIALRLTDPNSAMQVAADLGLTLEKRIGAFHVYSTAAKDVAAYTRLIAAAKAEQTVIRVSTVFGGGGPQFAFATDGVMFELKTPSSDLPQAARDVIAARRASSTKLGLGQFDVRVPPDVDPFDVAAALNALPDVSFAEPDLSHVGGSSGSFVVQTLDGCPDSLGLAYEQINVAQAWAIAGETRIGSIRVAVLDDSVDTTHADFAAVKPRRFDSVGQELPGINDADPRHGVACAGLTVARPATEGMQGVGFGADLLAVRVSISSPSLGDLITTNSSIKRGLDWAVTNGADVISMSWCTEPSLAVRSAIESAVRTGRSGLGCVVVAAAGNDGGPVKFPASLDSVIAVAATDDDRELKRGIDWSSNFGPEIDVAAPGTQSFTTAPGGGYGCLDGTSAAAAIVAGAAALVLRLKPMLSAKAVRDLLIATSDTRSAGSAAADAIIHFIDVSAAATAASR